MFEYSKKELAPGRFEYQIPTPHPPEISCIQRAPLKVYISEPKQGIDSETIPLLALHGHGGLGNKDYLESLHESIREKRNILVITVEYLGLRTIRGETTSLFLEKGSLQITNSLLKQRGFPGVSSSVLKQPDPIGLILGYIKTIFQEKR